MVEAEGIVDGYVGERIASKIIDLKLTDDNYYFEIDDYEEITDWFENIPEGLEAIVVGHIPTSIHVSFEGVPKEEKDEFIKVKVPDGYIIDSNSEDSIGDLENTPSEKAVYQITVKQPLAEYERESIVKGTVGETLEAQNVYVQLYNTTCEISMIGHEFPIHNGLTGKVKDISVNLKEGELLGFAGLLGSGRTETAEMLFGAEKVSQGTIKKKGTKVNLSNPHAAIMEKIAFCPEDRKVDGIIGDYNYVFDPDASLKRFFGEGTPGRYVFLVDEAHNLPDRAREMYSAWINRQDVMDARKICRALYPKLRIVARDNVIRVLGDEEQMAAFEESTERMRQHVLKFNSLNEENILDIVKGRRTTDDIPDDVVCYSMSGRAIKARSQNQQQLIDAYQQNDMVFAVGPAGTGKTYLSIALAVKALKDKTAKKIILSRPAVEAGEKLGFLPGDMKEKIDPYLQPLYDALEDMLPQVKLQDMMEKNIIQIAPLAFMRGRTLSDAVVILDEAQNTTPAQIRMFLTRMGWNTKMIITGDMTQIDLPKSQKSGLVEALHILNNVEGIGIVNLTGKDIVRHKLVTRIVNAYERFDKEVKEVKEVKEDNNESINKD